MTIEKIQRWARQVIRKPLLWGTGVTLREFDSFQTLPSRADCMIVAGPVTKKALPLITRMYYAMPAPRYLIAVNNDEGEQGRFAGSYAVVQDMAQHMPIDITIKSSRVSIRAALDALKIKLQS